MLGIRERGKRLQKEIEKTAPVARNVDSSLDESSVQAAKKVKVASPVELTKS